MTWSWLPGWDSIESAGWWSHFWFWTGIACLVALAAAEVVSHMYGLRKDELISIAEIDANNQRQTDAATAEERRKAEVGSLQKQLTDAGQKVAELQKQQIPRRLTDEQRTTLVTALLPFKGQKVTIRAPAGNAEGNAFARDFVAVFEAAGWDYKKPGADMLQTITTPPLAHLVLGHGAAGVEPGGRGVNSAMEIHRFTPWFIGPIPMP